MLKSWNGGTSHPTGIRWIGLCWLMVTGVGRGLTGLILWAEIGLRRVPSPFIETEKIRFANVDEFFELTAESEHDYEYTVSWIDCFASGKSLGRGLFYRGNHYECEPWSRRLKKSRLLPRVPFDMPNGLLNGLTLKAFNTVFYYQTVLYKKVHRITSYDPFFFPLDTIIPPDWNRLYGTAGFLQYQFVLPLANNDYGLIKDILARISHSGILPFLNVFKTFGDIPSPGMLSFPRPGITLALDFPFRCEKTLRFLDELDTVVRANGGRVYPSKDARMSAESFRANYPNWR